MSKTTTNPTLERRDFLVSSSGGFLLGFLIDGATRVSKAAGLSPAETQVNAYIRVSPDNKITILFGGCEMGQGALSGLAQVIAEDLMIDWDQVRVETAPPSAISYLTGGSSAVRGRYAKLRTAGATVREMMIAAAAAAWGTSPANCYASRGSVFLRGSSQSRTYGSLASAVAALPVPVNPPLVDPANFRLIGKPLPRLDIPAKTDGSALFGIDTRLDGMLYAVVKHCPSIGGTLNGTPPVPRGAIAVVPLTASDTRGAMIAGTTNAVAIVATNTYAAMQAARELQAKWALPASVAGLESNAILTQAQQLLNNGSALEAERAGNATAAIASAPKILDFTYTFPYLAHATLEPLNCTADVTADRCRVWAPNQAANWVLATAKAVTGLDASKIEVFTTLLGGGLGRKIEQDYVSQAIQTSKALQKPVKLTWPRSEDFGHDQYRPMAVIRVRAGIDNAGNILGWHSRNVSPSILGQRGWLGPATVDSQATEGLTGLPYLTTSKLTEWVKHPGQIPVGFWRSVGHSFNAYAVECMIDEIAAAVKTDPFLYRQTQITTDLRSKAVLSAADLMSGWRKTLPSGRSWGMALAESFGSIVCQVVEISGKAGGPITVHRVAIAVDCGAAVNPDSVAAQMQGGMVHGLASILWGQVKFTNGVASVKNFNNYRMLRMREMPVVEVQVVNSGTPSGGIGEPATPPIGPAIANAYAKLTGIRVRTLPMFPNLAMMGD